MKRLTYWISAIVLPIALLWFLTSSWGRPQIFHEITAKGIEPNFQVTARAPFALIVSVDFLQNTPLSYYYHRYYFFWFFGYYTKIGD